MTKVDFGGLKQKLMTSIVAISAIQVLQAFMNDRAKYRQHQACVAGRRSMSLFLVSMLVVALADRLSEDGEEPEHARSEENVIRTRPGRRFIAEGFSVRRSPSRVHGARRWPPARRHPYRRALIAR